MKTSKKPNILFIVADDHRHDAIQAFDNMEIQTPVLDSLVSRGVSFLKTYITGGLTPAVCVPGRACITTGNHTLNASKGRLLNRWPYLMTINPELSFLPEMLCQSGYHTFATGKWHNDKQSFIKGFCDGSKIFFGGMSEHTNVPVYEFDPTGSYSKEKRYIGKKFSTDLFTDAAVKFIETYQKENPFFLYLAYTSPHDPR